MKVLVYKRIKLGVHFILCLTLWRRVTHTLRLRVMGSVPERSGIYASLNYGRSCTALWGFFSFLIFAFRCESLREEN